MAITIKKTPARAEAGAAPRLDGVRVLVLFGGSELFGAERANLEVFRSLAELGLQARFITHQKFGPAQIQPELDRLGFEWTTAPFGTLWARWLLGREWYYWFINLYGMIVTNWRVWREARRWQATHLYAVNAVHYSYASFGIKWLRLPLVYRAGDEFPRHNFIYRWTVRNIVRRADVLVANSAFIRDRCAANGVPMEKLRVIYNYPPERTEAAEPVSLPAVPTGAVVVVYVGQLSEHKGVLVLLETAEQLLRAGKNFVFWLVGNPCWDNGQFAAIKQRVADMGLTERIIFFGYQKNVRPFLERADVHVCPSLFAEPSANVVGEAKQAGKPSVIFPSGGLPELVEHAVDGFVCREKTMAALAEGIEFFAANPAKRRAAGAAARLSLEEKFGHERFVRQWGEVFGSSGNLRRLPNGSDGRRAG